MQLGQKRKKIGSTAAATPSIDRVKLLIADCPVTDAPILKFTPLIATPIAYSRFSSMIS